MHEPEAIVRQVRAALEHEPRINLHRYPIDVTWSNADIILDHSS